MGEFSGLMAPKNEVGLLKGPGEKEDIYFFGPREASELLSFFSHISSSFWSPLLPLSFISSILYFLYPVNTFSYYT